jgi:hypothetical protein
VRAVYAHDALLDMSPEGDLAAPGGAITAALCGSWDHPPPCPLAPHHTRALPQADGVGLRVLFAVEPGGEAEVRDRIDRALAAGFCDGPDGGRTSWVLRWSGAGAVAVHERAHAERLARS